MNKETSAILGAIETAHKSAQIIADQVSKELLVHTQHDDDRFKLLTVLVESIAIDVKSLLESRTFGRGIWWTVTKIGTWIAGGAAATWAVFTYFRGGQ